MTFSENPIGLFDSGIGGLSIWQAIHAMLPRESTLYLADSKH
ncbi:MAG: glutamate racemase, partial [Flavobacteriaceae bacterium]|nr:glutamate racemase [Flavobacteriaceae bacterium]